MTERQEKLLTEKFIRPMVRKMLKEAHTGIMSPGIFTKNVIQLTEKWNEINMLFSRNDSEEQDDASYKIKNLFYTSIGNNKSIDENKMKELAQKYESTIFNK